MDYDAMDWVDGYRFIEENACDCDMDALLEEYERMQPRPKLTFYR